MRVDLLAIETLRVRRLRRRLLLRALAVTVLLAALLGDLGYFGWQWYQLRTALAAQEAAMTRYTRVIAETREAARIEEQARAAESLRAAQPSVSVLGLLDKLTRLLPGTVTIVTLTLAPNGDLTLTGTAPDYSTVAGLIERVRADGTWLTPVIAFPGGGSGKQLTFTLTARAAGGGR